MTLEQANAYITGLSGEVLAEAAKNSGSASALIYASQYEQYLAWFRAGEDIENEDGTVMSTTELGRLLTNLVMNMKDSIIREMTTRYSNGYVFSVGSTSSGGRQYFGTPILGTLPNVLDYRTTYIPECTSNWFASYTNKAAALQSILRQERQEREQGFVHGQVLRRRS